MFFFSYRRVKPRIELYQNKSEFHLKLYETYTFYTGKIIKEIVHS